MICMACDLAIESPSRELSGRRFLASWLLQEHMQNSLFRAEFCICFGNDLI